MVGRGFISNPWAFAMTDALLYPHTQRPSVQNNTRWQVLRRYGLHADAEERIWGTKIRRFLVKAVQGLFVGEHNAKKFRITLDHVAGLPKTLEAQGRVDTTPLSRHILDAASACFSEEVLFRTAEESYARFLEHETKNKDASNVAATWFIQDWYTTRNDYQHKINAVAHDKTLAEEINSNHFHSTHETGEISQALP